jgi:DNA-binding CsgD family transcriptional regulator
MTGHPIPSIGLPRLRSPSVSAVEGVVGRLALAALAVAIVLVAVEAAIPGAEVDAVWLASAASVILLARHLRFWPSVLLTIWTASVVVLLVIRPSDGLAGASAGDLAALVLFFAVAILGSWAISRRGQAPAATIGIRRAPELVEPLTEREREILGLLVAGMSNRDIAEVLVVSSNTVKTHLEHLYGKLAVTSRLQATARARELGLIEPR